jgi:hypothetical protein
MGRGEVGFFLLGVRVGGGERYFDRLTHNARDPYYTRLREHNRG